MVLLTPEGVGFVPKDFMKTLRKTCRIFGTFGNKRTTGSGAFGINEDGITKLVSELLGVTSEKKLKEFMFDFYSKKVKYAKAAYICPCLGNISNLNRDLHYVDNLNLTSYEELPEWICWINRTDGVLHLKTNVYHQGAGVSIPSGKILVLHNSGVYGLY